MMTSFFKEISDTEFDLLRNVIFKESGISLTDKKKALIQSRLIKRLRILNLDSYKTYYDYLIQNYNNEIENLINSITTNKTDFFREIKHFEFIKEKILPDFEKNGIKKIRIWSAGCSTGEEPYSIAVIFSEYYKDKKMPDIKILATDIDTNVLMSGKAGIYRNEVLEAVSTDIMHKYFKRYNDEKINSWIISDSIKEMVYFRRLNLLDEEYPMNKKFDLIFCRNVIIYFDGNTRNKVINRFYDYLNDDGYFFAGHSENLSHFSDKYYLIGNTIYKKKT
ncbi:MAG: protein-glutamate O-methyltransferase CheR [Spirochaetes bacterium]|nr:protein-glutamate O-methyltransferase CheR [Spirochaetota bacterium]